MSATYTIDGVEIATVREGSVELVQSAEAGTVGVGRLVIDDAAGSLSIVGLKSLTVDDDACADPAIFRGFVGSRPISRGTFRTLTGRRIEVEVRDLNDLLGRRAIRTVHGRRRSEYLSTRMRWIIASEYLSGLVADRGFVDYPDVVMDANDYTNSRPGDVIADCALRVGYNFFVYTEPVNNLAALWFRDSATSTDFSSTLRISNVLADVDEETTFASSLDAQLERDPDLVFSGVSLPYARGTVHETNPDTATAFVARDGVAPTATVKTAVRASALAQRFLDDADHEIDTVTDSILVPNAKVDLLQAGMRVQARYEHYGPEGYADFTWFRVLERRLQPSKTSGLSRLGLRLSPQEDLPPPPPPPAVMVQCKSTFSAAETTVTLDSPVTVGNLLVSRMITRNTETIPEMFPGDGWTLLASGAAAGINTHGAVAMYGKIATSTSQVIGRNVSGQSQFTVCEIANKGLDDITAISRTHNGGGVCNMGSGSGSLGLWVIAVPRGDDSHGNGYDITPSAGWTVEKNQDIDNGVACQFAPADPWMWEARIEGQTTVTISATIAPHQCGTLNILREWCAAAIFV